jgi:hypothetical protein
LSLPFFHTLFLISPLFFFPTLFFGKQTRADTYKLGYSLVPIELAVTCTLISPTLGLLCFRIPRVKCVVSVSPSECDPSPKRNKCTVKQLPCSWVSHAPHSF